MDELIVHVSEKTYAYGAIRVENQNLLSTISKLKTRLKTVEKGMNAASSVRRPMNRDTHVKNSVLANSKNSAKKVAVYVRKNKQTDNTSANVISNKENVNDVNVANAAKAKTLLCVSCMQNVLIPCHDNCLAKYKLNVHSNDRRDFSTNSRTPTSSNTTYIVLKTKFSKKLTQSKSLDTIFVVSKPKIDVGSTSNAKHKVSTASKTKKQNLRDNFSSIYMKNKIRTSRIWQKWFESQPNVVWSSVNTTPNVHNSRSSVKSSSPVKKWVVKLPTCPCVGSLCVAGLGHNLFSVGKFCDGDLEVAFRSKTYETPEIIKKFIAQAQLNYKAKVCKIRTDNGPEFKNATLKAHYEKLGIMQQFLTARTPQQNGVVERRNHTLVEAARTMLIFSRLPEFLWAEAKRSFDTPINSAAQSTQFHEDLPSTSSIIVENHKAPPIETTSDEQTSLVSLTDADEFNQEDSIDFNGNMDFVPYNTSSHEEIESSTADLELSNVQNFHQV
ncbi:retrovirus-related pol polyprotein from transposon TNT 1-94 [Tanacetum coccineum]